MSTYRDRGGRRERRRRGAVAGRGHRSQWTHREWRETVYLHSHGRWDKDVAHEDVVGRMNMTTASPQHWRSVPTLTEIRANLHVMYQRMHFYSIITYSCPITLLPHLTPPLSLSHTLSFYTYSTNLWVRVVQARTISGQRRESLR